MNNNTNELDTIIELTDTVTSQSPVMPQNGMLQDVTLQTAIHDEAIFDSLKTLKTTNGASFMPPYADGPSTPKNDVPNAAEMHNVADTTIGNDDIIELDSNAVVHPQYTVTTELFSTPLAFGEQKKQSEKIEKIESVHIDTVHINTICASKTLCDSLHLEAAAPNVPTDVSAVPEVKDVNKDIQDETSAPKSVCDAKSEDFGDTKEPLTAHESMKEILGDVRALQETVAKMQSRLAAQDASIASLEARLVVAEAKNRELVERCCQIQAPQFDEVQLEKVTAAVAAKVVREEIQALLDIVEQ